MIRANVTASLVILAMCGASSARADDWPDIAGDLAKAGVTPALTYQGDVASNVSGGARRGSTYTDLLHAQVRFDFDKLANMPGLSAFLDGIRIGGGQPDALVGDAQGISNITAPSAVRLYEAWVQYNFADNRVSVLAGRYDLNTEFYHLVSSAWFLNSSFGIGPELSQSGFGDASVFPDTSLALRVAYKPSEQTVVQLAILDGAPLDPQNGSPNAFNPHDGVLVVAEAAWFNGPPASPDSPGHPFQIGRGDTPLTYDDKIAVGGWYYTATFNEIAGPPAQHRGEGGAYGLLDWLLFQSANDPARRLTGFVQFGVADSVVDRFGTYVGAGLTMSALLPNRPDDQFGIAAAMARNGSSYIRSQQQAARPVSDAETAIELSYQAQIMPWLALQPDVQYVVHPNTDPRLHDATVAQLRCTLTF